MRVAYLSLLSDTGHVVPLLKIAKIFQSNCFDVLCIGPSEAQSLSESAGIAFHDVGTVRPADCAKYMKVMTAKTKWWRHLCYDNWFNVNYLEKSIFNGHQKKHRLLEATRKFDPDLIIADDQFFLDVYCDIATQLGKPLILNNAEGSFHKELADIPLKMGWQNYCFMFVKCILEVWYFTFKWLYSPLFMARRLREQRSKLFSKASSFRVESAPDRKNNIQTISPGISHLESMLVPDKISGCHKTKVMGPLPVVASGKLENEIRDWLDARGHVVYVSFGTMIQIQASLIGKIISAIDDLQLSVLWASPDCPDKEFFATNPDKFRWVDWVSQTAVLGHPSIRAFITHGGAGAVQESIWFGVPMIVIPHMWDQSYNALRAEQFGVAIRLARKKATKEEIMTAIQRALALSDRTKDVSLGFVAAECSQEIIAMGKECISLSKNLKIHS